MTSSTDMPSVLHFVTLHRYVASLQQSVAFYCDALGFQISTRQYGHRNKAVLTLGTDCIVLTERTAINIGTERPEPASGPNLRFQHIAIATRDMEAAFKRLQAQAQVAAISRGGPQHLPVASGGVCAFKFRDPDGHPLELIEFPQDQCSTRWKATVRGGCTTLGIDHAAISVTDVDRSIAFYQRLGLELSTRQFNHGEEQSRLDGLTLAKVDVATLLPADANSPHLELLGYLLPKPFLDETESRDMADILIWQARASHSANRKVIGGNCMICTDPDGHRNGLMN